MNNSSITYELLRFKNSSDEQFLEAMEVYRKTTSHDQKTDIKEITYWVDNLKQFEIGELFFFGLKANGLVIGYAELAYIKQERILIIDYINIASEYRTNSSFYSFYSLIMNYMDQNNCDYDYITIEILSKYGNKPIRNEEVCQYELENFKMVNTLYIQPLLETHNDESSTEALIMIYTRAGESYQLKKETFLHIVDTIYNYYLYWDSKVCDIKELTKRGALKDVNTNSIRESINDDYIVLTGCPLNALARANLNKIPPKRSNTLWIALLCCLIIVGLVLGILYLLKMMDYEINSLITIGVFILIIFLLLLILIDKSILKTLKKIPIFSALSALK